MIYAINKRTKEHHIINESLGLFRSAEYLWVHACSWEGGWIEWSEEQGNPLPDGARCDVLVGGRVVPYVTAHNRQNWEGVTHYRPILSERAEPESAVWDGEGIPPVGTRCEIMLEGREWVEGEVVYIGKVRGMFATDSDEGIFTMHAQPKFRSIRTDEEKAVEAMQRVCRKATGHGCSDGMARALYRAGYRRHDEC